MKTEHWCEIQNIFDEWNSTTLIDNTLKYMKETSMGVQKYIIDQKLLSFE